MDIFMAQSMHEGPLAANPATATTQTLENSFLHELLQLAQQRFRGLHVEFNVAVAILPRKYNGLGVERSQRFALRLRHAQMHPAHRILGDEFRSEERRVGKACRS